MAQVARAAATMAGCASRLSKRPLPDFARASRSQSSASLNSAMTSAPRGSAHARSNISGDWVPCPGQTTAKPDIASGLERMHEHAGGQQVGAAARARACLDEAVVDGHGLALPAGPCDAARCEEV